MILMAARSIGVFLPVYNHARHLAKSIPSLLQQSNPLAQILIVDDASNDDSLETIRSLTREHSHVEVVSKSQHGGIFDSHRIAQERLDTPYFYSAAADDWILDGFFDKSFAMLEQFSQAAFCCADCLLLNDGKNRFVEQQLNLGKSPRFVSSEEYLQLIRERENFGFPCNAVLLRSEALKRAGGFRSELRWHSDWFTLHILAMRHGFCYVPEPLTVFRLSESGLSGNTSSKIQEKKSLFRGFFEALREPAYQDTRSTWQTPSILNPSNGARWLLLKMALCNPRNWWFLSWNLVKACLRDRFRRPLWDALWFLISPLNSRRFNTIKLKLLKLFGATVSGVPRIEPYVHIECPWNLTLHDQSILARGVRIWAREKIEIGPNAIIDREAAIYSAGWDEKTSPITWKERPVRVGKGAHIGVRALLMPGADVLPEESIPPMSVVR